MFWFVFPWQLVVEHLFMYLLAICLSSLGECLFSSSAHFKSWIFFFFFLLLSCISSLCFLESKPLSDICFANIFSHFIGCAFTLMIISLDVQKHFSLFVCFFVCFCCYIQKRVAKANAKELFPYVFFLAVFSFQVLCPSHWSVLS